MYFTDRWGQIRGEIWLPSRLSELTYNFISLQFCLRKAENEPIGTYWSSKQPNQHSTGLNDTVRSQSNTRL